jgi:very-short-patch-repair endonuclease
MDWSRIRELAERQHALVSRDQLLELGLNSTTISRMRRSGEWERYTKRVLKRSGVPRTYEQWLMAAALDAGPTSFVSHDASAALWKVSGFGLLHLRHADVSRPRGGTRRPSDLARIHELLDLEPDHTTMLNGIPISTPTRVVFELAGARPERAERACDNLWSRNLTSRNLLMKMFDEWADRGRAGTVLMREILERRPQGYVPPASNLESRFRWLAEREGVGPFRRQVDLGGEVWIGRVDFLDQRCPLVVVVLSEEYHGALCDQLDDARRFEALDAAGFTVESIWDHEIWLNPGPAMARVKAAEARLLRGKAA